MTHVIVASTNPVKIDAARQAFTAMFPHKSFTFEGVKAESNVAEQPLSSDETRTGAHNRVAHAQTLQPLADYWVAFEGGLEERDSHLKSVIWVAIQNKQNIFSDTTCASFVLPDKIASLVRSGLSLGDADDQAFGRTNSKQQNGAIGLLTQDVLTRTSVYRDGAILALIPFKNRELY